MSFGLAPAFCHSTPFRQDADAVHVVDAAWTSMKPIFKASIYVSATNSLFRNPDWRAPLIKNLRLNSIA
jgi:hypothetical protein